MVDLYSNDGGGTPRQRGRAGHPAARGGGVPADREAAAGRLELKVDNRTNHGLSDRVIPAGFVHRIVFRAHKCKARTCPKCGPQLGFKLRGALLDKAEDFELPGLLTLTVDRDNFDGPEAAHEFITNMGRLRLLLRHLGLKRWVWVLEFQQRTGTGWPHWHILVDLAEAQGRRIDLERAWSFWRDKWGIGGLDLQVKRGVKSSAHAVNYITKYLLKQPHMGYPRWVLESEKKIRLFQGSRAVGALVRPSSPVERAAGDPDDDKPKRTRTVGKRRTNAERMGGCKRTSTAMLETIDRTTGEVSWEWLGGVDVSPDRLAFLAAGYGMSSPLEAETVTRVFGDDEVSELSAFMPVPHRLKAKDLMDQLRGELDARGECNRTNQQIGEAIDALLSGNPFDGRDKKEDDDDLPF